MKIVTAAEMREIDQAAGSTYGVPEIVLMENAGVQVAHETKRLLQGVEDKSIVIFCGAGNNGGDGFVAGRHLANLGAKVKVFLLGDLQQLSEAAQLNLDIITNMDLDIRQIASPRDWDKVQVVLAFADGIVDALLGTGFHGDLSEDLERLISMINEAEKPVLAIDMPSGVAADSGFISQTAVAASATVTFGLPKLGQIFYPGGAYTGKLLVDGIGIPRALLEEEKIQQALIDIHLVKKLLVPRAADVHKNSCGRVLAIAGSRGYTGAAVLTAESALRSGSGLVRLAAPAGLHDVLAGKLTEVILQPVPENENGMIAEAAVTDLLEAAETCDVVVIGPGLGRDEETARAIRSFVLQAEVQLILDADAIRAFCAQPEKLSQAAVMPVLTPHLGEMAALLGISVGELKADLLATTRQAAADYNSIFVVKSEKTIVVFPDGNVYIASNGNPGMATAGSGDVLAGAIAGLKAQGLSRYNAALAGVFLHGMAGDLAAEQGMTGLLARDILAALPAARLAVGNE